MRFAIKHEIPGRVRVDLHGSLPEHDAIALVELMERHELVRSCKVYAQTGSLAIVYEPGEGNREAVLDSLALVDVAEVESATTAIVGARAIDSSFAGQLIGLVAARAIKRWLVPKPIAIVWTVANAIRFFWEAAQSLAKGRVDTPVLDGAAVAVSLLTRDFKTAGTTMFLLTVGDMLQELTRRRSQEALVDSLLDIPTSAWVVHGGTEVLVDIDQVDTDDLVRVRMGSRIPVDGVIAAGEAQVNQATLTGEPLAIPRVVGDDVFAGTVVEAGEIDIRVSVAPRQTKLRQVASLVSRSESLKSTSESRMSMLADQLVPWNFLLAGTVFALTRNITKMSAALMVDYSCALKFAGSIASLTAMREGAVHGFTVKGASCFESIDKADTIVFDKTGTLTEGRPRVCKIIALGNWSEDEVLRLSACLEEHFPHPVARAVVEEAQARGLEHREQHAEVEYIVAHGIASSLGGQRVIIGSDHFAFDDEGITYDRRRTSTLKRQIDGYSPLFLAVDGRLAGIICIEDPLREGIAQDLKQLRNLGVERIVMLTGDSRQTAERIAAEAGIDEFCAGMLPEQKHAYLEQLHAEGRHVIMVGDGVNDSPALSLADIGIAMGDGAAIAREVADVTLGANSIGAIVKLRRLSRAYNRRMDRSFAVIIGLNSALLALGVFGAIAPTVSSLVHNGSTVAMCALNSRVYLPEDSASDEMERS